MIDLFFNIYINFGNGLGDLMYVYLIIGLVIIFIIVKYFINRIADYKRKIRFNVFTILTLIFITIQITYAFTYGRGVLYPWNGEIFYPDKAYRIQKQKEKAQFQKSLDSLSQNIEQYPNDYQNYLHRAKFLSKAYKFEEANNDYLKVIELNDTLENVYIEIGIFYRQEDKYSKALKYYQKALELNPTSDYIKSSIEALENKLK